MRIPFGLVTPVFRLLERLGVHVTPRHFHFPIPDTGRLPDSLWSRTSALPGIEMEEAAQLAFLERLAARFGEEWRAFPSAPGASGGFHLENGHFESVDAEIYFGLIRDRRPGRILEIGSGYSTRLAIEALSRNRTEGAEGSLRVCDLRPPEWVRAARGPVERVLASPVEEVPLSEFTSLRRSDILFIDSSHVLTIGNDVQFLFLEVLPRLAPGVLVHVHDVFLPAEYPRYWVRDRLRFWNEQYVLQAFLAFNREFRVLWGSRFMTLRHADRVRAAIPSFRPERVPGSFWMERVGEDVAGKGPAD